MAENWIKSSRCGESTHCTEVAFTDEGVNVRDSKDPSGPVLRFTREEWEAVAKARLDELGLTYAELVQMNRDGVFKTHQHKALWVLIGGTLDEEQSHG